MVGETTTGQAPRWALSLLLAATVFSFVLGSSSVAEVLHVGTKGRWLFLALVWCAAAKLAWSSGLRRVRTVPPFWVAAAALPLLGVISAAWSVDARLTVGRAVSLAILASAASMLAFACTGFPDLQPAVLLGLLGGVVAAGIVGGLLVLVDYDAAVQASGPGIPPRYRGLGENPNTYSMLAAAALPLAAWATAAARSRLARAGGVASYLVVFGSIVASGSRGAFVAAFVGACGFVIVAARRRRLVLVLATLVVFGIGLGLGELPHGSPIRTPPPVDATGAAGGGGAPEPVSPRWRAVAEAMKPVVEGFPGRLQDELGRPVNGNSGLIERRLFSTSGRLGAWVGAVEETKRPVTGYGFGTADRVFVDRFYAFQGGSPENAWISTYMQLGVVGVLVLAAFWLVICRAAWAAFRAGGRERAALVGVCAAGLALTLPQAYPTSVGNVATLTVWVAAALLCGSAVQGTPTAGTT
jgi:hypothetical protein